MRQQFLLAETYLLCSSIENSPNSLGEAMLTGVPCAAAAVGGVPSMLSEKEGELFDPAAPGEMQRQSPPSGPTRPWRKKRPPPPGRAPWPSTTRRPWPPPCWTFTAGFAPAADSKKRKWTPWPLW